jgi:hypothetical protein
MPVTEQVYEEGRTKLQNGYTGLFTRCYRAEFWNKIYTPANIRNINDACQTLSIMNEAGNFIQTMVCFRLPKWREPLHISKVGRQNSRCAK